MHLKMQNTCHIYIAMVTKLNLKLEYNIIFFYFRHSKTKMVGYTWKMRELSLKTICMQKLCIVLVSKYDP